MSEDMSPETSTDAGGTGTSAESAGTWFDGLPESMKTNEQYAGWKDKAPADLLTTLSETQGKLAGAIVPPGESATPEERKAFDAAVRKALGVPESVDQYQITLPEGVTKEDPVFQAFANTSLAHGLTSQQLNGVMADVLQAIVGNREAQKAANKELIQGLWKDKFQENLSLAIRGMEGLAADSGLTKEDVADLAEALPTHAMLARMFSTIGKYYSEDRFIGGPGGAPEKNLTASGIPKLIYDKSPTMRW